MPAPLFHLALLDEWDAALAVGGPYQRSTRGLSLQEQGYIHCSGPDQVQGVADAFYGGDAVVVLLVIDPARLDVELRYEDVPGAAAPFPHLYGPLRLDAVAAVEPLGRDDQGRLALADALARHPATDHPATD